MRQYYHNPPNYTISVEPLSKQLLDSYINLKIFSGIAIDVGIARLNPKDKFYVKKTGREVADKNSYHLSFSLTNIEIKNDIMIYQLVSETFTIYLRTVPTSDKVYFIYAHIN